MSHIFILIPTKKILYFRHFVQLISTSFPDKSTKYLNLTALIQIYYLFPIDIKNAAYSSSILYAALSIFFIQLQGFLMSLQSLRYPL